MKRGEKTRKQYQNGGQSDQISERVEILRTESTSTKCTSYMNFK